MTSSSSLCLLRPLLQRSSKSTTTLVLHRSFSSGGGGTRGSRGHGWFVKYRQGLGGRHLQGEYYDAPSLEEKQEWNDSIFQYGTEQVQVTMELDGETQHTLDVELATTVLPKTCLNFQKLLDDGLYEDSIVHRIEKGVGLCMGDTLHKEGKGGMCHKDLSLIPGGATMETEPLVLYHVPGILTMLSPGIDKVDSRFVILTHQAVQMDGRHVAFARLANKESLELVQDWEESVFTKRGKPTIEMKIVNGGCDGGKDDEEDAPATA